MTAELLTPLTVTVIEVLFTPAQSGMISPPGG
jgi:hypothetical protein